MQLFSEPSLLGPIFVGRTVLPDLQTPGVKITKLELQIDYDFNRRRNQGKTLTVEAPPGMTPFFEIDTTDLSGLGSGRGNVVRSYPPATSVKISAPRTYGEFQFVEWREGGSWINGELTGGKIFDKNSDMTISMNANRTVQAVYTIRSQ